MKPSIPSFGINRRALLSTLAVLPVLSAPLFSASASAQTAPPGSALPSWNDGPAKQAILDFVRDHHRQGKPELRAARGAHRHVRSGRHALGRAPDVHADDVLPRPGAGARDTRSRR